MTEAELDAMQPASEVFPPDVFVILTALPGSAAAADGQTTVALALDQDVIAAFQSTGDGWRGRINDVLRREAIELGRRGEAVTPSRKPARKPARTRSA